MLQRLNQHRSHGPIFFASQLHIYDYNFADLLKKVFVWNKENLDSQLPLQPGSQACFTLYIHGASDYLPLSQSGQFYRLLVVEE